MALRSMGLKTMNMKNVRPESAVELEKMTGDNLLSFLNEWRNPDKLRMNADFAGLGGCAAGVPAPGGAGFAGADSRSAFPNVGFRAKHAGMARESRPWPLSGTLQAGIPARIPPLSGRQAAARRPIRLTFSARNARSHSPRALARPRTLKRRKPIASLIQPFGASESHFRLA